MFRVVLSIIATMIAVVCSAHAESVVRTEQFKSSLLGRELSYVVYLPDGYETPHKRYSVLYLLHGAGGDESSWMELAAIREKADALIAKGDMPATIIIMPGCKTCWWIDGPTEKAESAFWTELVPAISKRYRTIETREGRLIAGLSAGGYGAVRYAMRYPDKIGAVAALSPAVYSDTPPAHSAARSQPPFLLPDGAFNQASWTAKNYPSLLGWYREQKHRVPMYLVSGDQDKFGIAFETALLFKHVFDHQPEAAELRIVDGDHSWAVWANAIDGALKYIFRFAAKPQVIVPGTAEPAPVVATVRR